MTRKIKATKAQLILVNAATLATVEKLPASEAITRASNAAKANDVDRKMVQDAFVAAMIHCPPGKGVDFHRSIIEHAYRIVQRKEKGLKVSTTVGSLKNKLSASGVDTERKQKMSENIDNIDNNDNTNEATETQSTGRKKKYNIGDVFPVTSAMGLQPTAEGGEVPFQFSRKTGREGLMDLAIDTEITYIGTKQVYADKPSSKRMIFKIPQGTEFTLDGELQELDEDLLVSGVPNHIDPTDDYVVNRNNRSEERAQKASLKAEAEAAAAAAKLAAESEAA